MGLLLDARQRRKLGLTERNVRPMLMSMEANGDFAGRGLTNLLADSASIALSVLKQLKADNPQAFCDADAKEIDWDRLFELLEKLIEMLLPFIIKHRNKKPTPD